MKNRRLPTPFDRLVPDTQAVLLLGVSLVLAVVLWASTAGLQTAPREFTVPLTYTGLGGNRMVTGEMARGKVTLIVRGTPELLRRLTEEDFRVEVDTSGLPAGPQVHEIEADDLRLPSSVELERVVPATIHFTVDKKIRRELPLEPAFTGRPPRGMQILSWNVEPPKVTVEGPESLLNPMRRVSTQPVPLEGHNQDFEAAVVAAPQSESIEVVNPQTHRLKATVGELLSQRAVSPVGIRAIRTPAGTEVVLLPTSLTVMVEGPQSLVSRLGPGDLVAEVNLRGLRPSPKPYQLKPAIRLADTTSRERVEITSWIPKFVDVTVHRKTPPESTKP